MIADTSTSNNAKRRILEYVYPKPPPQEDCIDSGLIGLVDYYLYEGADVRDLLLDLAIVIADTLVTRNPGVEFHIDGAQVVLTNRRVVYLNVSSRIDDEWHKPDPNADLVASRIESELLEQLRFAQPGDCTEPGDSTSISCRPPSAPGR
ncbi:MAG: hypothetical protein J0M24_27930 [Verrucomicrobia bacterium]|nr:hypothetical protein [Verrucomicrobiota bacterium]